MIIGPPLKLTCPYCGGDKYIESILSGNTLGGKVRSDTKREYPMLSSPSPVQWCPHCDRFYFYSDARIEFVEEAKAKDSFERTESLMNKNGELGFSDVDLAFSELYSDSISAKKQNDLLFLWLFAYNDEFGYRWSRENRDKHMDIKWRLARMPFRRGSKRRLPFEEFKKNRERVMRLLIERNSHNPLFVAELYREMFKFDKCKEILLPLLDSDDKITATVAKQIFEHAKRFDYSVFQIEF